MDDSLHPYLRRAEETIEAAELRLARVLHQTQGCHHCPWEKLPTAEQLKFQEQARVRLGTTAKFNRVKALSKVQNSVLQLWVLDLLNGWEFAPVWYNDVCVELIAEMRLHHHPGFDAIRTWILEEAAIRFLGV